MTLTDFTSSFSVLDALALTILFVSWAGIGWRIENPGPNKPSVSLLMNAHRRDWMREMVTRQPRMFDSQIIGLMRQGTAFFASASMVAIGAGLALIGNPTPLVGFAQDLQLTGSPAIVWEIKLILILIFLSNAFLKFVWSHRLFGYCAILMAAVPNDPENPVAYPRASQAAEVSITAARSFNKAMRATYFALASTAWLLGAAALIAATLITLGMLYRREFTSKSRAAILAPTPGDHTPS